MGDLEGTRFVWASIIAVSQVLDAVKDVFPMTKRHKAASDHVHQLESLFIDAQLEWENIFSGRYTDDEIMHRRQAMTGSDLGAITGLTSGAITGVVARLEQAGYLRREPDPHDGRKQILHLALKRARIQDVVDPLREDVAALLEHFDNHQLTAIAEFLTRCADLVYRHAALLRAQTLSATLGVTEERRLQP